MHAVNVTFDIWRNFGGLLGLVHYRISGLRRVSKPHGDDKQAHGKGFAVGHRWRNPDSDARHGKDLVCRVSYFSGLVVACLIHTHTNPPLFNNYMNTLNGQNAAYTAHRFILAKIVL